MIDVNLVTPKTAPKLKLLFNKLASGSYMCVAFDKIPLYR